MDRRTADHGDTPGNAGANTAADHQQVLSAALDQLPWRPGYRVGRKVLVRTDSGGGSHEFLEYLHKRRLQYSVGFGRSETSADAIDTVVEVSGLADLSAWPQGHPTGPTEGTTTSRRPVRITDVDGHRITGFLTNTGGGQLADLELRHHRHARVEDRIRAAKDTGLRNLPFHDAAQNRVWLEVCAMAADLIAWTQRLALTGWARIAEPKRLRLRLFGVAGRLVRTGRRLTLKIPDTWPWAGQVIGVLGLPSGPAPEHSSPGPTSMDFGEPAIDPVEVIIG